MKLSIKLLCAVVLSAMLGGCASNDAVERRDNNQFVSEFYARVESVHEVKFKSSLGPAMAIGALDGLLSNVHYDRDAMLGGALIGGLFAGVLTSIFEGPSKGYEYQLEAVDGDLVTVIVNSRGARQGECVIVRVSGSVTITRQAMRFCEAREI